MNALSSLFEMLNELSKCSGGFSITEYFYFLEFLKIFTMNTKKEWKMRGNLKIHLQKILLNKNMSNRLAPFQSTISLAHLFSLWESVTTLLCKQNEPIFRKRSQVK